MLIVNTIEPAVAIVLIITCGADDKYSFLVFARYWSPQDKPAGFNTGSTFLSPVLGLRKIGPILSKLPLGNFEGIGEPSF
jgi:hypothetical protein